MLCNLSPHFLLVFAQIAFAFPTDLPPQPLIDEFNFRADKAEAKFFQNRPKWQDLRLLDSVIEDEYPLLTQTRYLDYGGTVNSI
jgi:hypothetical protein